MTIEAALSRRIKAYQYRKIRIGRKIQFLATCRGITFLLMITGFSFSFGNSLALQGAALFLTSTAVFLYLMVIHDRCYKFKERLEMVTQILSDDLARATWRFADISAPSSLTFEDSHPFAHDLDFSGSNSILKLLDNTYHDKARALLKSWIDTPDSVDEIKLRQQAVADLAPRRRFRQNLALAARLNGVANLDAEMLQPWLSEPMPRTLTTSAYIIGRILATLTTTSVIGHFLFNMNWPWLPLLILQLVVFYSFDHIHRNFNMSFMTSGKALSAVCASVRTFEQTPVKTELLQQFKSNLLIDGNKAGKSLARLIDLHEYLSYRTNGFAHFFLNGLLLWDQHFLYRLAAWRRQYGEHLPGWVHSVVGVEALAALANYSQLFPEQPFPQLREGDEIFLKAEKMAHPCLPRNIRVGNDYQMIQEGRLHLITGSNMSGKSTFLRTVGTNLILARLGAPVCAQQLTCSLPQLWTSIHIQDSLAQGVSYFYAEVRRIKDILDHIGQHGKPVFYLMDEILKGTNSHERLIATKAMVNYLLDHKASGLITTHDLELLAIERERPDAVTNYHFQEQVEGDEMFFDYSLKSGELTSTNALRVMRHAGVPLVFEEE